MGVYLISDSLKDLVRLHTPLTRLDAKAREALSARFEPHTLEVGEELDLDPLRAFVLLGGGRVDILHEGYVAEEIDKPEIAGLLEFATRYQGRVRLRAVEQVESWYIPVEGFDEAYRTVKWIREYLRRFYEVQLIRLSEERKDLERHLDDYFTPGDAGLVPGPYYDRNVRMYVFHLSTDPARLESVLPPGVRPLPFFRNRYMIVATRFSGMCSRSPLGGSRRFDYGELAVFIPCRVWGCQVGFFCPELFPDNYLAIILGRELYGFPKRFGETRFKDTAPGRAGNIEMGTADGTHMRLSWAERTAIDKKAMTQDLLDLGRMPQRLHRAAEGLAGLYFDKTNDPFLGDELPEVPVVVRQRVPEPACSDGSRAIVDRLVRVPFLVRELRDIYRLEKPDIQFLEEETTFGGTCDAAYRVELAFEFGQREVVKHYGLLKNPLEGPVRRLAHRLDRYRYFGGRVVRMFRTEEPADSQPPPDDDPFGDRRDFNYRVEQRAEY